MQKIKQISVIGLGLLGASLTLAIKRSLAQIKTVGYAHRKTTRQKATDYDVADIVTGDLNQAVKDADIVILATPIGLFEKYFDQISDFIKDRCVVTDVGSTKQLAHKWAKKSLTKRAAYVGSHPIAGSEKRGLEFARDDLFAGANCIITSDASTDKQAVKTLSEFWQSLGSIVYQMTPARHDKMLGSISHMPHLMAAALVNASKFEDLKLAGKGFLDTSRIASGPPNVWTDIFMTNSQNTVKDIDRVIKQLEKLKNAIVSKDAKKIEKMLDKARNSRAKLIDYKIQKGEILT